MTGFYTKEEKIKLGQIFQYLRNKNNLSVTDVCHQICSEKVYRAIEKGEVKKNDEYYDKLINYFHYHYLSMESLFEWLESFVFKLYRACDFLDEKTIDDLFNEYKAFFRNKESCIGYEQYHLLFSYLFRYYKDNQYLNASEIKDSLELIHVFEEPLQILFIEVLDLSNWNYAGDKSLFDPIFAWVEKYKENSIAMHHYALKLKLDIQFLESLDILAILEEKTIKNKNDYRHFEALLSKFNIYKNIDQKRAKEIIPFLINQADSNKIPERLIYNTYYNIANYYYMNNDYENAYSLFQKTLSENKNYHAKLIFVSVCCRELNRELPDELLEFKDDQPGNAVYLEYFRKMKKGADASTLENFIMKEILSELKRNAYYEPYWHIFQKEIARLSKTTHHYILNQKFLENIDLYCKNSR